VRSRELPQPLSNHVDHGLQLRIKILPHHGAWRHHPLVRGGQARVHATAQVTVLPDGTVLFNEERVRLTPL
jgi:hypothetical protein